jgi:hypothetical protein
MPYDPGTHNRAGEIYAKFMGDAAMAAAQLRLQGAQAMAQGISSAGSSLGKGIQSFGEQWQQSAFTRDYMGSRMEEFAKSGIVSPEMMDKFHKGSLGAQAGIYAQGSALYDTWLKSQGAEEELGRTVRLRQSEADISRQGLGQRTYVPDPNDPNKWIVAGTQTGSASYSPVTEKERQVSNKPGPIFVEGGAYDWKLNPQGYWEPDYTKVLKINKPITQPLSVWPVGTPGASTAPTGP